ncbi:cocaine- and amphetamine-regulated transcript protein-like [Leptodactylus fuscus]|uniref:cocaine- and amphetamine-regulated transcript protein-like n=1 Tax=Leptodactylus fuscus TaxID=238119 RepID=UPI003F4E7978
MARARRCPAQTSPKHCALLMALYLSALILPGKSEDPRLEVYQEEELPLQANSLAVALGDILDYTQDKALVLEKKALQVPRCDVGERCAMKHGPRIGKLCDCLRGASCNTFMLRCY